MLNREIKVDVVKKKKTEIPTIDEINFETRAVFMANLIDESVQKVMTGVLAYVVLDTVRKVIITIASKEKK